MKKGILSALFAAGACFACAADEVSPGSAVVDGNRLILDAFTTNVTTEADLGSVTEIVLKNGATVAFDPPAVAGVDVPQISLSKTYLIEGDGLSATGIVSVAAGKKVIAANKSKLVTGTLGHTFVKNGTGILQLDVGPGVTTVPTHWIVEEGPVIQGGYDFFGSHKTTTTSVLIDVREGARYQTCDTHCPIGPVELTGATLTINGGTIASDWGGTAFRGGVHVHACETESVVRMSGTATAHLNHEYDDVPFVVEEGAVLKVYGTLRNGWNTGFTAEVPNKLVASGGGVLYLIGDNYFTGGVKISDGTKVVVSCATSLGRGGALEIDGNATIEVLAGTTLEISSITGTGTLTKTGAGVLTCANVADGVTIVRTEGEGSQGASIVDGNVILNGGMLFINVPDGDTLQLTGFTSQDAEVQKTCDITKTGGGTLVLPDADNAWEYRKLIVDQGEVKIAAGTNLSSGGTTLQNGGMLSFTKTTSVSSRKINANGECVINVPEGLTATVHTNAFSLSNARLTKIGKGKLNFSEGSFFAKVDKTANTHLIAHEGTVIFAQDCFGNHVAHPAQILEVHSGAKFAVNAHVPVGRVVMRGGTLGINNDVSFVGDLESATIRGSTDNPLIEWGPCYSFNGKVEVYPGANGEESVINAGRIYLAHNSSSRMNVTEFNVAEGASLRICGTRIDDGRNSSGSAPVATGFMKTGKGELILDSDAGFTGVAQIEEGVFTIGECGRIDASARLNVTPGATVRLADGAVLTAGVDANEAFIKTADVWFDATQLSARSGNLVTRVPNLGTAGGAFEKFKVGTIPTAPVYTPDAINGKPALHFNGGAALVTDAYTNKTATMSVFMVAQWTSWDYNGGKGGKGHWGGGLSMITDKATTDDNGTYYSFHTETTTEIKNTYIQASQITESNPTVKNPNREVGTSYLDEIVCNGSQMQARQYVGPGIDDATVSVNQKSGVNFDVNRMCVGGRLTKQGACQYGGSTTASVNRMYIGYIGEVIVFTRVLTEDEKNVVRAYLKRKWFADDSVQGATGTIGNSAGGVTIDVPEGAAALAGAWTSTGAQSGAPIFTKTGAGTLNLRTAVTGDGVVKAEEGTLEMSGRKVASRADVWLDAADVSSVTLTDGKVSSVVNKGRSGGAFGAAPGKSSGTTVSFPAYEEGGINGRNVLRFDWKSGLMLDTYTNVYTGRRMHMYMVLQRMEYHEAGNRGKWGGPYSFLSTSATGNDEGQVTASHFEETLTNTVTVYVGTVTKGYTLPSGKLDEPYIFTQHQMGKSALTSFEWAEDATNKVLLLRHPGNAIISTNEVNRILLGGRGTIGGRMQWSSDENRCWNGRMGEVLIFTEMLSKQEEAALQAYLRAKWLGKGDAPTEAPLFLSGEYAPPSFDGAGLELGDGTVVEQAGPTCALASLVAGDNVTFVRDQAGDASTFALFDVAGGMLFGANPALEVITSPGATAKFIGGVAPADMPDWTVSGDKANTSRIIRRADGIYLSVGSGTVLYLR